jgi:hypothetical protein
LGSAFFVVQPASSADVSGFQFHVREEFATASIQIFGDQPMFEEVPLVVSAINNFYQKSADAMIAILTPPASEDDLVKVAQATYHNLEVALKPVRVAEPQVLGAETKIEIPQNFMQEAPLPNIIPQQKLRASFPEENLPAVRNRVLPWVTLQK